MPITINGSGTITGASTLATTVASPTFTTPNINSAQFATVSGTAPIYACRAWVNFNGSGTVAIRASGNVTSITDGGTGQYTVNFTTAMPDADFVCEVSAYDAASGATAIKVQPYRTVSTSSQPLAGTNAAGTSYSDLDQIHVAIFR